MGTGKRAKKAYKVNSERNSNAHIREKVGKFRELSPDSVISDSDLKSIFNKNRFSEFLYMYQLWTFEEEEIIKDIESGIAFSPLYEALREDE